MDFPAGPELHPLIPAPPQTSRHTAEQTPEQQGENDRPDCDQELFAVPAVTPTSLTPMIPGV
jgi:hypothetical protein